MNKPNSVVRERIAHLLGMARSARHFRRAELHTYFIRTAWRLRNEVRNAKPKPVV